MEKSLLSSAEQSGDDVDRISLLPDDILHRILKRVDIFEAVQTSILSSRWQFVWTTLPYLDIDMLGYYSKRPGLGFDYFVAEKFKDFINWVLISQGGSRIVKFRLCCSNAFIKNVILRWIFALSRRNVEELDLSFDPSVNFELPHCLLACDSLRSLKLNLCGRVLLVRGNARFRNLRSLELVSMELVVKDMTKGLFSGCPFLESLSLLYCVVRNMHVLDITSASLKHLSIDSNGEIDRDGDGYCGVNVKVSCPNLVSFDYGAPAASSYSLENLSSLETVCIFLMLGYREPSAEEVGWRMCYVLCKIPDARVLKLNKGVLQCIGSTLDGLKWFNIGFRRLKSLTLLLAVNEQRLMAVMIYLLKCSPNLEALTLVSEEIKDEDKKWEVQGDDIACLEASRLKMVQVLEFRGNEYELKVVRFLLKHGLVLEKMTVSLGEPEENSEPVAKRSKPVAETLLQFPRSSPNVAVVVVNPHEKGGEAGQGDGGV